MRERTREALGFPNLSFAVFTVPFIASVTSTQPARVWAYRDNRSIVLGIVLSGYQIDESDDGFEDVLAPRERLCVLRGWC